MSDLESMVVCNRIGWLALKHRDGWWVGTAQGVTCYARRDIAQGALTIVWQREGGRRLDYRIETFTGAKVNAGEHVPKKSAVAAIQDYENRSRSWE